MKNVLIIDVGGTNLKVGMRGKPRLKIPSGKSMTASGMAAATSSFGAGSS